MGLNPLPKAGYRMVDIKEFAATFNRIAVSKSEDMVFSDFLNI
jgi:hypothetical protein